MGLIYKGNGNQEFLEKWLERVMINLDGTSIGTYNIENKEEILNALINCQLYSEGERKSNTDKILDELKKGYEHNGNTTETLYLYKRNEWGNIMLKTIILIKKW